MCDEEGDVHAAQSWTRNEGEQVLRAVSLIAIGALLGAGAVQAASAGAANFAPDHCDYAVTFPKPPVVTPPKAGAKPGHVTNVAQTPQGYQPWLVVQCTEMASGTAGLDARLRESEDKAMFAELDAQHVVTSSSTDARGEVTTTVGDVVDEGKPMVFTKLYIVGPRSILLVTALEPRGGDHAIRDRFFAQIVRKPS
jgi:hypothetical protein